MNPRLLKEQDANITEYFSMRLKFVGLSLQLHSLSDNFMVLTK
jgi:hypothetical protein